MLLKTAATGQAGVGTIAPRQVDQAGRDCTIGLAPHGVRLREQLHKEYQVQTQAELIIAIFDQLEAERPIENRNDVETMVDPRYRGID